MEINVKKRSAHDIFLGVDIVSKETKLISEVASGAKCGCICAYCKNPLEARKGMKRRHHFAHVTNYDCMYSNEVAIYQRIAEILDRDKLFCVPSVTLKFDNWLEPALLKEKQCLKIDTVSYCCAPKQYPPELIVSLSDSRLRILIEFGEKYYSGSDLDRFKADAREQGYSILLLKMLKPCEETVDYYTTENLTKCLMNYGISGKWVLSALEEKWRKKFLNLVIGQRKIQGKYECPLHKSSPGVQEKFFVDQWVCSHCEYYLGEERCIGASGIKAISDFDLSPEELQSKVKALQKANEEKTAEQERYHVESLRKLKERERQMRARMASRSSSVLPLASPSLPKSKAQLMHDEAQRIFESFDSLSLEKTVDSFGRRWVKCNDCGKILLEEQIAKFESPNRGLCKFCWHDGFCSSNPKRDPSGKWENMP